MSTAEDTTRPVACVRAEQASDGWADVVRLQRWAEPDHADFYALAGELVTTLAALDDLAGLLARQIGGYPVGRRLYDDTGTVDPRTRLAAALEALAATRVGLAATYRCGNEFWSALGHLGVEVGPR